MLRITQQDDSAGAKRYYSAADYYTEGQELIGMWGGKGAQMLGLDGTVDKESFDQLCDNLNPQNGQRLTACTRTERRVGYDFTFSVPKSVSLLYAMTDDQDILGAFRSAVDETMRDIESEMKTRVRKDGKNTDRETGNAVWAEFIHTTSRPVGGIPDPQLHSHCFVFNATFDEKEKRWKAGQFGHLKADAPYFQAAFRARLADKLQDLGFGVDRKRDDFEITGVPASVIKKFSRRTEEIEQKYVEILAERMAKLKHGVIDDGKFRLDGKTLSDEEILAEAKKFGIGGASLKAALGATTREEKNKELSWEELQRAWADRMSGDEWSAIFDTSRRDTPHERPAGRETEAVDYAIAHCFTREAVVSERKLLTEALKRGVGSVTLQSTQAELAKRPLIRGVAQGRPMVTTDDMRSSEARLITIARQGRGRLQPVGKGKRTIERERFNDEQKAAVHHVLGSRDLVTIVRGAAGTGKTTTVEDELRRAWAEAGVAVVALAQSTEAVKELRTGAGFEDAATIARFFVDRDMQAQVRGGVILVDESSQLGTKDMLRLFDLARDTKARVVLVGDKRQHRSVNAGEPLKLLEERAGLRVAEVTEIVRQTHRGYRDAAKSLIDGDTAKGFAILDELGWIKEIPHAGRYWVMGQEYLAATKEKDGNGNAKTALCVSPTHAEAGRITQFIRDALKAEGKLKDGESVSTWVPASLTDAEKTDATMYDAGTLLQFHQNVPGHQNGSRLVVSEGSKLPLEYADRFAVFRPGNIELAAGDRVRITHNGKTKDGKHALNNGALFTVQGFTAKGDVKVDNGWVIGRDFGHLAYGYSVTSHAAQGKTVHKVFIGESSESASAINQRSFYVPVTRGKEQAMVFTDDKKALLNAVQRPDSPLSATEFTLSQRRKWALAGRLRRHLSNVRRAATFARTHGAATHEKVRERTIDRERGYAR